MVCRIISDYIQKIFSIWGIHILTVDSSSNTFLEWHDITELECLIGYFSRSP
jgi:hypothetical protein